MVFKISLKAARINAELSQSAAAEKVGVSIATIKNWEKNKTFPNQPMLERMCEVYGVPYDMLKFF